MVSIFSFGESFFVVEVVEAVFFIAGFDDRFGHFDAALAALRPDVGLHDGHAELRAFFLDEFEFFLCVGGEGVKSNDYRQAE